MISHRIPFDSAPEAFQLLDEHLDQTLAVILMYD
jgi:threonine dehydrogenase-like Zn-dependent dehydrogenase